MLGFRKFCMSSARSFRGGVRVEVVEVSRLRVSRLLFDAISRAGPRAKTRDSPLELALASSEPQPKSVAPAPSSGPTTGSPSRFSLARCARSLSADGCRKSGWLTTASCRLSDGRVQDVWSVTVYVRSVLVTSTVGLSNRCTRFRCPSSLTQSSARPAKQEEPSGKKISIGSENR